jgi:hypothetical protein
VALFFVLGMIVCFCHCDNDAHWDAHQRNEQAVMETKKMVEREICL